MKIKEYINRITEFGLNENVQSKNKMLEIKQILIGLYAEYLRLETEIDTTDYEDTINLDYDGLRANVSANFPELGWYHSIWESHKINEDPDFCTGDAIDDLTDIIKDMLDVQWRFENNSEKDALYQFGFLMKNHSEQHLVDLVKYLKDLDG